jgi:hypothetical protein
MHVFDNGVIICRAGKHVIVFLERGPLYLVAVSSQGEPESLLREQLKCLYAQIVCILTTKFETNFVKNPGYDSRRLLGTPLPPSFPACLLTGTECPLGGSMHQLLHFFAPSCQKRCPEVERQQHICFTCEMKRTDSLFTLSVSDCAYRF